MKRPSTGFLIFAMNRIKMGCALSLNLKRGEIPDVTINQLYKFTDMQVTFGCNMLALDKGLPRTMNDQAYDLLRGSNTALK